MAIIRRAAYHSIKEHSTDSDHTNLNNVDFCSVLQKDLKLSLVVFDVFRDTDK